SPRYLSSLTTVREAFMTDCIFCRIVSGAIPASIVARSEHAVAFRDLNPQAPSHVLVVPRAHIGSAADTDSDSGELAMGRTMRLAVQVANQLGLVEGGYRLVCNSGADAGQSVF